MNSVEMFLSEIHLEEQLQNRNKNSHKLFTNVFRNSEADPHFPMASEPRQLGVQRARRQATEKGTKRLLGHTLLW